MVVTAKERTEQITGRKPKGERQGPVLRFKLDGVEHLVDPNTLTIREQYLARKVIDDHGFPVSAQFVSAGMAWVVVRRSLPDVTFDQIIDSVTLADLSAVVEGDDSPEA